ncbi:phytanoyl-CoA dioxygenase family protein [Arenibacterium sp. CAU 1754]
MALAQHIEELAAQVGSHDVSSIAVTDDERRAGALTPDKAELAARLFAQNGYLRVDNLFSPEQMQNFDTAFRETSRPFLARTNKQDKRPLFTLPIAGPINDAGLLANPLLKPLLSGALGEDFIVATVSGIASFPGAPDQFLHRDAKQLFGKDNQADHDLPPYSITMLVPLVDANAETGSTRVWPGTHHVAGTEEGLKTGSIDPEVRVGSVLLTDGRVLHRGIANRSDRIRPLLYLTFHRSWYRDFGGYEQRPPIQISAREFARMTPDLQARVGWFHRTYAKVARKYWLRRLLPPALRTRLARDI